MKTVFLFLLLLTLSFKGKGQKMSTDFKTITVNKQINEFPDKFDLSSPLSSFVTFNYIVINGKDRLLRAASSSKIKIFLPDSTATNSRVSEDARNRLLNTKINEVIIYKDSIAFVISHYEEAYYAIRSFYFEENNWVNSGESGSYNIEKARLFIADRAKLFLQDLQRIDASATIPTDTASFISYIKEKGNDPKDFILKKLRNFKLVMYGEVHYRRVSWALLKELITDKRFALTTGVLFMEMASDKQADIDKFLSKDTIDKELLLDVFRDYMVEGWNDKEKFDFIIEIWKVNKKLSVNRKIKIIAVDTPRPFGTFHSKEDMNNSDATYGDRNRFMAEAILNYLKIKKNKRNALFIVGLGHIYKTGASAGSILTHKMPHNSYTIFTHCPRIAEGYKINERIRHGIFDYAFYRSGDHAVAFELKNSPFGKEPFDALYDEGTGSFQDNYDGYIFFGPLDKEPNGEMLVEMYNTNFISEIDRRYRLMGTSLKEEWQLKELSRDALLEKLLSEHTKTRWESYIKPLKDGKINQ